MIIPPYINTAAYGKKTTLQSNYFLGSNIDLGCWVGAGLYTNCQYHLKSTDHTICQGSEIIFTATPSSDAGNNIQYQWRVNGVNKGSKTSDNTYTTSSLQNNNVVTVVFTSDCTGNNPVTSNSISVNVNPIPTITNTTPGDRCGNGTLTLSATASAGTVNWYASATGGISLGTGTSFTTPSLSATKSYYVDATANGCTTASRTEVIATVNTIPTITARPQTAVVEMEM